MKNTLITLAYAIGAVMVGGAIVTICVLLATGVPH